MVKDRGVAVAQASRDLDVHENVLRKWVRDAKTYPQHAFPGQGHMKPEQFEIDRLRREVAKLVPSIALERRYFLMTEAWTSSGRPQKLGAGSWPRRTAGGCRHGRCSGA